MRRLSVVLLFASLFVSAANSDELDVYRGQTITQWLEQLSHPSPSARAAAAQAFVKIGRGNEGAVEPLIGLLRDQDERVRFYAAYALGSTDRQHRHAANALIQALPDTDEHVRYATQWSLVQIVKQLAASPDRNAKAVLETLANIETELLVAGALPGHARSVREAIAGLQPTTSRPENNEAQGDHVVDTPPAAAVDDHLAEIDAILQQLASDDLHDRVKAISAFKAHGPQAVARLFETPGPISEQGTITWLLTREIASLGKLVSPILLGHLTSPDELLGGMATDALIEMDDLGDEALSQLIDLLDGEDVSDDVRLRALRVMIAMGPKASGAINVLVSLLDNENEDEWIVAQAVEALGAIGPAAKQAVPAIVVLLHSEQRRNSQATVARALVQIDANSQQVKSELLRAFEESADIYAAIAIAEQLALCDVDDEAVTTQLLDMFQEAFDYERAEVIRLLGHFGNARREDAMNLLLDRLFDPGEDLFVRVTAAKSLGELGPTAIEPIAQALLYGDETQQLVAARALIEIGGAAAPARNALIETIGERRGDPELRALAEVALGQIDPDEGASAELLTEILHDGEADSYLRSMAAISLAQLDQNATPILEALLDDSVADVQIAVAYALCRIDAAHAAGIAKLVQWLESDEWRDKSVNALVDIGESSLPQVVNKMNDSSQTSETRLACIDVISSFDERANPALLAALNVQTLAQRAGWALRDRGNDLLPTLVAGAEDEANYSSNARDIMFSVVEDMVSGMGAGGDDETWRQANALVHQDDTAEMFAMESNSGTARESLEMAMPQAMVVGPDPSENFGAMEEMALPPTVENAEPLVQPEPPVEDLSSGPTADGYKTVEVFYGTNRKPLDAAANSQGGSSRIVWLVLIGVLASITVYFVVLYRRGAVLQAMAGMIGVTLLLMLGLIFWLPGKLRDAIDKPGPSYGGEINDQLEIGVCEVTIPDIHQEGELEAPTLMKFQITEDPEKHIVLKRVKRLGTDEFFVQMDRELQNRGSSILVFVHGFNVSFEDAARRTAQMTSDLNFAGASVFYSWPSQAEWWKYRVDEKNVELSVDPLKQFLLKLAEESNADTINLVAHSMGNRALTAALKEIDATTTQREQLFNQVILAAPDIDADIFKRRIAPAIVTKAKRVTLYASSKDLALVASRTFNGGDPRAGDAGGNLVVVPGIETIDVSQGDSSLLGHSYYGSSVSVLRDIEFLLQDKPVDSRKFLSASTHPSNMTYWTFQPERFAERPNRELIDR